MDDDQFRLAGEDAPRWIGAAFVLFGFALALMAATQIAQLPRVGQGDIPSEWRVASNAAEAPAPQPILAPPAPAPAPPPAPVSPPQPAPVLPLKAVETSAPPLAAAIVPQATEKSPTATSSAPCLPVVSVPFTRKSARLAAEKLDAPTGPLRGWLTAHKEAVVSVEGHADASGEEAYNVLISYERARAVAGWLEKAGVAASQVDMVAAGARPARGASDGVSKREVVVQIEGVGNCRESQDRKP